MGGTSDTCQRIQRRRGLEGIGKVKPTEAFTELEYNKPEKMLTVMWHELPSWQQDNHFIIRGYRPASFCFMGSLWSLTYIHNESLNIITHLLGAVFFSLLSYYLYINLLPRYPTTTATDLCILAIFALSAVSCLSISATYHTISNHSPSVARIGNALDYLGIIVLIVGSFIPSVYYGFLCHPNLQKTYSTIMVLLAACCCVVCVMPMFRTPQWRPYRAGMFVSLGASSILPVLHGLKIFGWDDLDARMGLRWMVAQGVLYVCGAGIYASRIPERWGNGRFDIVGSSHQIFHCFVVVAALTQFKGLLVAFDFLHSKNRAAC